ncbi:MAG: hypothetical protein HC897_17870 [Thermoanaerobaculia bacterium]|nr:hypothetical protein [Thermoanaerobaculia bacterium]
MTFTQTTPLPRVPAAGLPSRLRLGHFHLPLPRRRRGEPEPALFFGAVHFFVQAAQLEHPRVVFVRVFEAVVALGETLVGRYEIAGTGLAREKRHG